MTRDSRPVLVLTANGDLHADFVVAKLAERDQPVVRYDPAEILYEGGGYDCRLTETGASFSLSTPSLAGFDALADVRSVLVRRPSGVGRNSDGPEDDRFFAGEALAVTESLMRMIAADAVWVNHPTANKEAGLKVRQLQLAHQHGLKLPDTLVTNNPETAFSFYTRYHESLICKPLSSTPFKSDGSKFIFTHALPRSMDRADFEDVSFGSSILQRHVEKTSDVRVAVIGDEIFGCEIRSQDLEISQVDWRKMPVGLPHREIEVPTAIARALRSLRRALSLSAMHCDFAIERETGEWFFFEANPNGQWLWLELSVGLPISDAIADLLIAGVEPKLT